MVNFMWCVYYHNKKCNKFGSVAQGDCQPYPTLSRVQHSKRTMDHQLLRKAEGPEMDRGQAEASQYH